MSQVFGRYVLEERLAEGGMGEVSLARQTGPDGFERWCVVKRMHAALAHDPHVVELFLHEARLMAQLSHPHIAQVYDFGKVDGVYYLAMERVEGATLREVLRDLRQRGLRMPLAHVCTVGLQVAQALECAHQARGPKGEALGLVHRDVSPSNILISKNGVTKLIDFGVAKTAARELLTRAGTVRGKVPYMSPEQLQGLEVDQRSDVYSLGLVLYELLTGARARDGQTADEVFDAARTRRLAPLEALRPDATRAIRQVVTRALEPERERRQQSASELALALERARADLTDAHSVRLGDLISALGAVAPAVKPTESNDGACPSETDLEAFSRGALAGPEAARVRAHLDGCDACRQVVSALSPEPSSNSLTTAAVGERIGRYVVEGRLGSGAMGLVLKARDPQLNRPVALKVLLPQGNSAERRTRLLRESQAAAQIRHPNVVSIYDVGEHGDELFIALELVEGPTLRAWLNAEPRPLARVIAVLREIGLGLEAIHAAGLVHRDIKPDNVLVDGAGHPRIADFGLVHVTHDSELEGELTKTGEVVGTPAYMAPEQLRGGVATAVSDQFSYCALAYEAVVGRRPFEGTTLVALRESIRSAALSSDAAGWRRAPGWLRSLLARGLAADPARRFESMHALNAEFAAKLERPRFAFTGALVSAAVLLAVVAGLGFWQFAPSPAAPPTLAAVPIEPPVPAAVPEPLPTEATAVGPEPLPTDATAVVPAEAAPTPVVVDQAPARSTGTLVVTSQTPLDVVVDGKSFGSTPRRVTLPEGPHAVTLRSKTAGVVHRASVVIEKGKVRPLDWYPPKVGVEVRAAPPQVEFSLFVDGAAVGSTPIAPFELTEGPHLVRATSDSGWVGEKKFVFGPGAWRLKITEHVGLELTRQDPSR